MADLLSTICVAYVLLTVASWRIEWLTDRWVVLGLAGTAIPDLVKVGILLDERTVESALGVPFTYAPLGTLGGVVVVTALLTLGFARRHWRRVFPLVLSGGVVGVALDGLRAYADGHAGPYLYPLLWRPPTPNLFVSADPLVLVVALAAAAATALLDRRVIGRRPEASSP
jgi:hypothetical protein